MRSSTDAREPDLRAAIPSTALTGAYDSPATQVVCGGPGEAAGAVATARRGWQAVRVDGGLLDDDTLALSAVVANNAMNRERQLLGPNSYARELGFDPSRSPLQLVCSSVTSWTPTRRFDLITCVHGLHYVGDKLAVLTRAASWLTDDGLLIADLDLASIRQADGRPAGRALSAALRQAGFACDPHRRRVTLVGRRDVSLPFTYLGADDRAGPNYTNQPAVHSYYEPR